MKFARQQDTPPLVRNGSFAAGLAGWEESAGVEHAAPLGDSPAVASLTGAPRFVARVPAGGQIRQYVERRDYLQYPSRRFVERLQAVPIGTNTLVLRATPDTLLDGTPLQTGEEAFRFVDADGLLVQPAGAQIELEDLRRDAHSGAYRVGRLQPDGSVQVSPIDRRLAWLADQSDYLGATYRYDVRTGYAVVTILGNAAFSRQLDEDVHPTPDQAPFVTGFSIAPDVAADGGSGKAVTVLGGNLYGIVLTLIEGTASSYGIVAGSVNQLIFSAVTPSNGRIGFRLTNSSGLSVEIGWTVGGSASSFTLPAVAGFQGDDVLIITSPTFAAARITGVARQEDRWVLTVRPLPAVPFLAPTNAQEETTVQTTATGALQNSSSGAFGSFVTVASVDGFLPGRRVRLYVGPSTSGLFIELTLAAVSGLDLRFIEQTATAGGLPLGSDLIQLDGAIDTIGSASFDDWRVGPTTVVNVTREMPVFAYDLTLAFSYYPREFDGVPQLQLVRRDGTLVADLPLRLLESGRLFEDVSTGESTESATFFRRRIQRFFLEAREPLEGRLRLTLAAGTRQVDFGDVVLYGGDFTRRHDLVDTDDPAVATTADRRSTLDRLPGGPDPTAGVLARGAVVLYVGGAVCPAGFKRLDAVPGSPIDGLELLPPPLSARYETERNRTILTWERSFDLLDEAGRVIPVAGRSEITAVSLPSAPPFNGASEALTVGTVQQRLQPGMSLRIRMSSAPGPESRRYDYAALIRQVDLLRAEQTGPAALTLPPAQQLTYPLFMQQAQFSAGEAQLLPIGPPSAVQPTTYAHTGLPFPPPSGSVAFPGTFFGLRNGDAEMTLANIRLQPVALGEIVFVRWAAGIGTATGAFLGVVTARHNFTASVRRLDGHAMVVDGTTNAVSGAASVSNPKYFDPSVVVTRTLFGGTVVWSARRFHTALQVTVFGDIVADVELYNQDGLLLEPSGFLRYGQPGFSRGSLGHSHEITRGDAPFNQNVAPHVNAANDAAVQTTAVARRHGHGALAPVWPIPRFIGVLLCEKL